MTPTFLTSLSKAAVCRYVNQYTLSGMLIFREHYDDDVKAGSSTSREDHLESIGGGMAAKQAEPAHIKNAMGKHIIIDRNKAIVTHKYASMHKVTRRS